MWKINFLLQQPCGLYFSHSALRLKAPMISVHFAHVCYLLRHARLFVTVDCSLPGSSVHGILQARILEWVAFPSPNSSVAKKSACNAGDPDSIPGSGRSSGEGIDYPLQYS